MPPVLSAIPMRRDDRRFLQLRPFPPPGTPEIERREQVNAARLDRLLMDDPAPFLHATTMDEIRELASEHGLLFNQAYALHKRAVAARYSPFFDHDY